MRSNQSQFTSEQKQPWFKNIGEICRSYLFFEGCRQGLVQKTKVLYPRVFFLGPGYQLGVKNYHSLSLNLRQTLILRGTCVIFHALFANVQNSHHSNLFFSYSLTDLTIDVRGSRFE